MMQQGRRAGVEQVLTIDPHTPEIGITILASSNSFPQVRLMILFRMVSAYEGWYLLPSEFTTFPLPPAYSPRVRSALNASSSSVRLSNLVGGNGWWYSWGRRIADV